MHCSVSGKLYATYVVIAIAIHQNIKEKLGCLDNEMLVLDFKVGVIAVENN